MVSSTRCGLIHVGASGRPASMLLKFGVLHTDPSGRSGTSFKLKALHYTSFSEIAGAWPRGCLPRVQEPFAIEICGTSFGMEF